MIIRIQIVNIIIFSIIFFCPLLIHAQEDVGKIRCICIDPGHGGKDPGCVGTKNHEKDIVLKMALRVGQLIKEQYPDIKVVYTRDKDVFVDLNQRGKIANNHKADLFMSIHINSFDNKSVEGIETYVLGLHQSAANLRVAMKENAVIKYEDDYSVKYDGFDPSKAESYIIFSMMQNLYLGKSLEIAGLIQEELVGVTKRKDRGVRQAGYLVLKDVAMPAVLLELGYISNAEEERSLASKNEQEKMAKGIAKAFGKYKEHVEKNSHVLANKEIKEEEEAGDFYYAIQIASSVTKMDKLPELSDYKVHELQTGERYRYFTGISTNYKKVHERLTEVKKIVKDCFIIAVHNGQMISVSEAKKIEEKNK